MAVATADESCEGAALVPCVSFTRKVGEEKVNPDADRCNHPACSDITVVATLASPDSLTIETDALIGASVN